MRLGTSSSSVWDIRPQSRESPGFSRGEDVNLEELKELHGTDGNEACHAFWDACGKELLALWEAANKFGKKEWAFMGRHGYMAGPDFHDALERLNKKASTMDA